MTSSVLRLQTAMAFVLSLINSIVCCPFFSLLLSCTEDLLHFIALAGPLPLSSSSEWKSSLYFPSVCIHSSQQLDKQGFIQSCTKELTFRPLNICSQHLILNNSYCVTNIQVLAYIRLQIGPKVVDWCLIAYSPIIPVCPPRTRAAPVVWREIYTGFFASLFCPPISLTKEFSQCYRKRPGLHLLSKTRGSIEWYGGSAFISLVVR